jgi:signal peptidase II
MQMNKRKIILSILFSIALIASDQALKYLIRLNGGFYICNKDLAFGLPFSLIIILIILAIIVLFFKIKKLKINKLIENCKLKIENLNRILFLSIILILAGALSNIIDRLLYGCVIDFIDLKFWPIFNLADIYITVGAIMLLVQSSKFKVKN